MRAQKWAAVALILAVTSIYSPNVSAQVLTTGEGVCKLCGDSELDTQRYVNSFLNQLFFPNTLPRRAAIAASLYMLTATYTMTGNLAPNPNLASVTIAITAELNKVIPTGRYKVTVTTPGGKTETKTYAIGNSRFSVKNGYKPGAVRDNVNPIGAGGNGHSGPPNRNGQYWRGSRGPQRPAKCSRARVEERGNETIAWCSRD